jgi:hypothetical protein
MVGLRLDHTSGGVGDGARSGTLGSPVCGIVGLSMLRSKRGPDRRRHLQQAGSRKAHLTAFALRHGCRGRSIGPPERNAKRPAVRVFDVGVTIALVRADQPNQRERPVPKRVSRQGDGHAARG